MLYTALYMSATRTQIYLTEAQRRRLDELAERRGTTLAGVIREAVDEYLDRVDPEAEAALKATFGVAPAFEVPSRDEWDRG
jgi:predicted transcriptional regulator